MAKLLANSGNPDQMPHSAASDLGLHYLLITLLWVSRLQWVVKLFLEKKCLDNLQTVETLIRGRIMQHLIWVYTVCH